MLATPAMASQLRSFLSSLRPILASIFHLPETLQSTNSLGDLVLYSEKHNANASDLRERSKLFLQSLSLYAGKKVSRKIGNLVTFDRN